MNVIKSSSNHLIKEVKSLQRRRYRELKGLFFIEGLRIVEEAIKHGEMIKYVLLSDQFLEAAELHNEGNIINAIHAKGYEAYVIPDKLFRDISDTSTPQGIMAVLGIKKRTLEEAAGGRNLFVLLESLQDPGNMGTIIRTADAAGFNAVIINSGCVDVYNPKVLRSTMGSIFHIPVILSSDISDAICFLKECKINVYAAHLQGDRNYFEAGMGKNSAIIIGNEAWGISRETVSNADILVRIPINGEAESLNASVAAGILMYECVR